MVGGAEAMNPVPLLGWEAPRNLWLNARAKGMGASDVAAALGFSRWETPWEVWASKTGRLVRQSDHAAAAAQLGTDLEPWLVAQAQPLLGLSVARTPHKLYAHSEVPWQLCSPDAFAEDGSLVETKTAGLLNQWVNLDEWADGGIPLGFELQGRWQMRVMDRPRVYFVGLVAGLGLVTRTVERDLVIEAELSRQVGDWWSGHVLADVEPPVGRQDLDSLLALYDRPELEAAVLLPFEALKWQAEYLLASGMEREGKQRKEELGALFKAALGNACSGKVDPDGKKPIVTWNPKKGEIDWEQMAKDLAAKADVPLPDPEGYRKPASRSLSVKKVG